MTFIGKWPRDAAKQAAQREAVAQRKTAETWERIYNTLGYFAFALGVPLGLAWALGKRFDGDVVGWVFFGAIVIFEAGLMMFAKFESSPQQGDESISAPPVVAEVIDPEVERLNEEMYRRGEEAARETKRVNDEKLRVYCDEQLVKQGWTRTETGGVAPWEKKDGL